jgi:hypothetical protein
VFSFAFLLTSFGFLFDPPSHRSTCCGLMALGPGLPHLGRLQANHFEPGSSRNTFPTHH